MISSDAIAERLRRIIGKGREDSPVVESPADSGAGSGAADLATAAAKSRARRGRSGPTVQKLDEQIKESRDAAALNELFQGENWEQVAAMYFDARMAMTGFDGFAISDPQKKMLGSTLSASMRLLVKIDPAYLALLVFTCNFGAIVAQKEAAWYQRQKIDAAKKSPATPIRPGMASA